MTESGENPDHSQRPSKSAHKSTRAFRTISEVSADLNLPQHVLRFWETKFNAVKPMKRGGGRRYYRLEDVDLLKQIRGLLYEDGYTIKGVQKLLRDGGGKLAPAATVAAQTEPSNTAPVTNLKDNRREDLQSILAELEDIRTELLDDIT
jgi:DNA-binding transcriptional MerR regulator